MAVRRLLMKSLTWCSLPEVPTALTCSAKEGCMYPSFTAMFVIARISSVIRTSCGQRSWHVKQVVHNHMKSLVRTRSFMPSTVIRIILRGLYLSSISPTGHPAVQVPHWKQRVICLPPGMLEISYLNLGSSLTVKYETTSPSIPNLCYFTLCFAVKILVGTMNLSFHSIGCMDRKTVKVNGSQDHVLILLASHFDPCTSRIMNKKRRQYTLLRLNLV